MTRLKMVESEFNSKGLDRWRFAVALAKFMVHVLHPGIPKSISVLLPSLVYQLDLDYTTAGFFVTMEVGMMYCACPISNYLSQRFNSRLVATLGGLLATFSLLIAFFSQTATSLGCSLFFTGFFASPLRQISDESLKQHYKEGFGFASTITQMGSQVGGFLVPYLTAKCLSAYGMRGALLFLGALMFHGVPAGAPMRPPRSSNKPEQTKNSSTSRYGEDHELECLQSNPDGCNDQESWSDQNTEFESTDFGEKRKSSAPAFMTKREANKETNCARFTWNAFRGYIASAINSSLVKNERVFIFILLPCQVLYGITYGNWAFFSVSYGVSMGMSEDEAVYLVMIGPVGGIIGRLVLIAVLYNYPLMAPYMFAISTGIASIALLMYPVNSSLTYLMICSFVTGFGLYTCFSANVAVISLKVEKTNFCKAVSYSLMVDGLAFLSSGLISGFLYDQLGSYPVIFRLMGILMGVISVGFSIFICVESRENVRNP